MKPRLLPALACFATATLAVACSRPATPARDHVKMPRASIAAPVAGAPSALHLTIHNEGYEQLARSQPAAVGMPGYAQVERALRLGLESGVNEIVFDDLPAAIDVEAATLRADGVAIVGQRYLSAPSSEDVLAQAVGQQVIVEYTAGGAKQTSKGRLLAADDGLTLVLDDGRIQVIRQYDSYRLDALHRALPRRATLQWDIQAQRDIDVQAVLAYPTGGLSWRAEYLATLSKRDDDRCHLALDGAAMIVNRSGRDYHDARVSLVAGSANLERIAANGGRLRDQSGYAEVAAAPASPPPPSQRSAGESHAYDLAGAARLANGSTERVPLFPVRPDVACERLYVVEAPGADWEPPQPLIHAAYRGQTGEIPVVTTVVLQNAKASGLGQPMPAGRVRVFEGTDLLGEAMLAHTATGAEIRLPVGNAFDMSAKREATSFRLDRAGRTITESFSVALHNAKTRPAMVRVIEPLPRWSEWEIVDSSAAPTKKDARHVQFDVPVPADGTATLTYTVRYRWPQDVKP